MFGNRFFGRGGGYFGLADPILRGAARARGDASTTTLPAVTLFARAAGFGRTAASALVTLSLYPGAAAIGTSTAHSTPVLVQRGPQGAARGQAVAQSGVAALRYHSAPAAANGAASAAVLALPILQYRTVATAVGAALSTATGQLADPLFAVARAIGHGVAAAADARAARTLSGAGLFLVVNPSHTTATDQRTYATVTRVA